MSPGLTRFGRIYVSLVILAGFLVIGESLSQLYQFPIGNRWLLLALLTLVSGSASVELPGSNVSISISEAFVFTAVLLYGPAAGTLTVALDGLVISFWIAKRRPEVGRALFNIAAPALSAWCSSQLFFLVSGIQPLAQQPASLNTILPALILFAIAYFALNSWLVAYRIALQRKTSAFQIWRRDFIWLSLNYFCGASVAILLVGFNRTIDLRFVGVVVPLLVVLYFTFKTSMQRVEDANKHVAAMNTLYLSTIRTLAMAIDAKDQVTHDHIRRVQEYAVGLAKQVGVVDENMIKAIEAAALLHDTGKLAVPEYILNKPGKLTPAESEKMKLHVTVGADILSAIDFPYPVVPIVRSHHENWDGTGYPQGLKGPDIPIGARILSVVDCFDALTSDRPYRPRLSDEDAMAILAQHRGSMYDPLIVDTFARVRREIAPAGLLPSPAHKAFTEIASAMQMGTAHSGSWLSTSVGSEGKESLIASDLAQAVQDKAILCDVCEVAIQQLRGLVPFTMFVLYLNDSTTEELELAFADGEGASLILGLRIPLAQRLSGWVAVNRQVVANSDPALDLGDLARTIEPALVSCLAAPLVSNNQLVGVLTLYSPTVDGFTGEHRRVIEGISESIAAAVVRVAEHGPARTGEIDVESLKRRS